MMGRVVAARHDAVPLPRIVTLDTILSVHAAAFGDDYEVIEIMHIESPICV